PTRPSTLSLHDALPIWARRGAALRQRWAGGAGQQPGEKYLPDHPFLPFPVPLSSRGRQGGGARRPRRCTASAHSYPCPPAGERRSEEHTSELQSRENLV